MPLNNFFAPLYELWGLLTIGNNGDFSFALWQNDLYSLFGMISWLSILTALLIFYFAIDHPRFNRWHSWLIVVLSFTVINGALGYFISWNTFSFDPNYNFTFEYLSFSIVNSIFTMIWFGIFTLMLRLTKITNFSRNCSTCPFPN